MLWFHHATIYLTIVFLLQVCSRTLCAQWMCHVLRTRLSRIPVSRITCHQLVYSYVSLSVSHVLLLYKCGLSTRLWLLVCSVFPLCVSRLVRLCFLLMPFSFCLVDSSMITITAYELLVIARRLVCWLVISGLWLAYDSFPLYEHL